MCAAAATSFLRFLPRIKANYDVGVVIFTLTFCLVSVSGYRVDNILKFALERLLTILISGTTCVIISTFICPVWAGEDLHNLLVLNLEKLASFLQGLGREYFQDFEDGDTAVVSDAHKLFPQGYKSVLDSKTAEEDLANLAKWEPGHGCFQFDHPWKQYLKIGDLIRQCAYQIEVLNGSVNSWIQAPQEFRTKIEESCRKMSSESRKALKALSSTINTMKHPYSANLHLENTKQAVEELKVALKAASLENADIQAITPAITVASTLTKIITCVEKIAKSVHKLSDLAHFKGVGVIVMPDTPVLLHPGSIDPVMRLDGVVQESVKPVGDHVAIEVHEASMDSITGTKESQTFGMKEAFFIDAFEGSCY